MIDHVLNESSAADLNLGSNINIYKNALEIPNMTGFHLWVVNLAGREIL